MDMYKRTMASFKYRRFDPLFIKQYIDNISAGFTIISENIFYLRTLFSRVLVVSRMSWIKRVSSRYSLRNQRILICLALLSLSLLCLTTLLNSPYYAITNTHATNSYAVVVDCGSTGSRAHIYTWPDIADNYLGLPDIRPLRNKDGDECIKKIEPGLSSVEDNPEAASEYIEPLMEFIGRNIPSDKHNDTQIYILATAGLRLLTDHTQSEIMSDLENDIPKQHGFPKVKARVLSGQEEGIYSWIAINYKAHRFNDPSTATPEVDQTKRTIGIIEMGGASLQVAFEVNNNEGTFVTEFLDNLPELTVASIREIDLSQGAVKRNYKLFVNTFLGVGVNSAREASVDLLLEKMLKNNNSKELESITFVTLTDPCLPKDSEEFVKRPRILSSQDMKKKTIVPKNDTELNVHITLKGSGNMKHCMIHLIRLIDILKAENIHCEHLSNCPMALLKTDFIPFNSHEFYGLSEFFYSTDELIDSAGIFNQARIESRTNEICLSTLSHLQNRFPYFNEHKPTRLLHECFRATWLLAFLEHGLNMPKQYSNFKTIERIDGEEIDWTLGAVIEKLTDSK